MKKKRTFKKIGLFILAVVVLLIAGFVIWGLTPAQPQQAALAALENSAQVTVIQQGSRIYFCPNQPQETTGFLFYPGGRVDFRAYAPALNQIAAQGVPVVLQRMPLSLAVMGINRADAVLTADFTLPCEETTVENWVLGGHSLGAAMAASYADSHLDQLAGLVLWAGYPPENNDLSNDGLPVLSLLGSENTPAQVENFVTTRQSLPADTNYVNIEGGNHAQFGDYGLQSGDGTATIPAQEQWNITAQSTLDFVLSLGK